jgi:Family of unknown function (DUF5317)
MILFVSVLLLAVVIGYLAGGRLRGFERLHLRHWWLAPIGLALQAVPLPDAPHGTDFLVRMGVLGVSYLLLLIFAGMNLRVPGMPLLLVGLTLNAVVVITNGGMPASRQALELSGQAEALERINEHEGGKHHVMTSADRLTPLADIIPIPEPIGQVASIGDVFIYAGLVWLIVAVMRGRTGEQAPPQAGWRYRGRHRPGSAEAPGQAPPPAAATTWGTSP